MAMSSAPPLLHGGNLGAAAALFPDAPRPFLDLSTGINPFAYPLPPLAPEIFARLPEADALERLQAAAARHYGAPSPAHVVAAPGTQSLLPHMAALLEPGRAAILAPTYGEYARVAAAAGHQVEEVADVGRLGAPLCVVVNPNNPDGRLVPKAALLALARRRQADGGLLVVDEAFVDAVGEDHSLAADVARGGLIVLRSFGKFFGLAGLRLGFALASPDIATRLRSALGPWAVSGPAIAIGTTALADRAWIEATRIRLAAAATRLDGLLGGAGLTIAGGTPLFRLVRTAQASRLFHRLGGTGIMVRHFPDQPELLRIGLPGAEACWERLRAAFARSG
ncbi:MAG TPA: threonine-phosphate decarboxylase CobD [Xanthobacteraceae bacterium]|nr:threonine-phosphate decarboxylase CobD [Xanthobacteraceae bacterium]